MVPRCVFLHPKTYQRLLRLRAEAEQEGAYRVAKRIHAVLLNTDGHTSGRIAEILKAPRSKASVWLANYEVYGENGLLEGHRSGRPPELSVDQRKSLGDVIESGPVAYGFDSGVWTSPLIGRIIKEEFGVTFHPGHIRKLLATMGFSLQRPRRLLARANVVEQNRWRRWTSPNIKKKPTRGDGHSSSRTRPVSGKIRPFTPPGPGKDPSRRSQ